MVFISWCWLSFKFIIPFINAELYWSFKLQFTSFLINLDPIEKINVSARLLCSKSILLKKYFVEIDCFCYKKQTLLPGEKSTYSITFYIDPIMINDSRFRNLNSMAISYTFLDSNNG